MLEINADERCKELASQQSLAFFSMAHGMQRQS